MNALYGVKMDEGGGGAFLHLGFQNKSREGIRHAHCLQRGGPGQPMRVSKTNINTNFIFTTFDTCYAVITLQNEIQH